MATRLLVIHRQLVFAVTIKQALEQTGGFAVHPFTKAEAAFDFLRDHPQDIALVDFNLPGRSGARVVQQLRNLQPDIVIIVTPRLPNDEMLNLGILASIDAPFTARELLPMLQNVLDEAPNDNLGITSGPPPGIGQMTTSSLSDQKNLKKQIGTTQNLGAASLVPPNEPSKTRILSSDENADDDKPQTKPLVDTPLRTPRPPYDDTADDKPQTKPLVNNPLRMPRHVADVPSSEPDRPQTRPFIDNPPPVSNPRRSKVDPFQTRNFDDQELDDLRPTTRPFVDDAPPPLAERDIDRYQTRNLQDDSGDDEPKSGTRILPETPSIPELDSLFTRRLDADDGPQTRELGKQSADPFGTRPLDGNMPPAPPEVSSLDRVLQSFGLDEPPPDDMDTPSVPTKDSDALRQFIATNNSGLDAGSFDDVLGAIEPHDTQTPKKQRQVDFEGLVKSMQRDEPQRRLPDRQQQQLLDFVLTTGMDSVLQEIEKTKTGTLPKQETPPPQPKVEPLPPKPTSLPTESSFKTLAHEEPPLPTLEENGTVSDLLVGISDSNFKDVLALLNDSDSSDSGSQASTPVPRKKPAKSDTGLFEDFLQATTIDSESVPIAKITPKAPRDNTDFNFDYDDDDNGETVAQVVLRSTQENTSTPGEFSLDQLMSDINDRLTSFKLKVRPLPSWEMDTTSFLAPIDSVSDQPKSKAAPPERRRPNEPSFLPEMFPPGDFIPPELPPLEASEVWTTRASEPSLEQIQPVEENAETVMEPGYFEETVAGQAAPTIDGDLFSGIMAEETAYDESPHYTDEAESSGSLTAFDWNEAELEIEAGPTVEAQTISSEIETSFEPTVVDGWDTGSIDAETEQEIPQSNEYPVEDVPIVEASQDNDWDSNWELPQSEQEATVAATEFISDDWEIPQTATAEPSAEAWDLPAPTATEPEPVTEPSQALTEEARIAQLALNLTQVSLEVSAEGTILTRDNQIIAIAGHLSQQDTIELGTVINNDWGTGGQGARLRFITLPSSGKEYMLYATGTDDNLILSMIFSGATPLRVIRQQGQRLVKALGQVPEDKPVEQVVTPPPRRNTQAVDEALEPYAYVWLVRDPEQPLNDAITQSITAGLMTQLSEMNWQIEQLQVQSDYVYLLANVPGEAPSYSVVKELKNRAATIAQKQDNMIEPQSLWADSYLVLSPGRELGSDEIQEFVDFQRMM